MSKSFIGYVAPLALGATFFASPSHAQLRGPMQAPIGPAAPNVSSNSAQVPAARPTYRVQKVRGDGNRLTIDSVEPPFIQPSQLRSGGWLKFGIVQRPNDDLSLIEVPVVGPVQRETMRRVR